MDDFGWLVMAYEQERADERAYWNATTVLYLGGLTVVAALTASSLTLSSWAWAALPLVLWPLIVYFMHQAVIGGFRRNLLFALEEAISSNRRPLTVNGVLIPDVPYSRYAWGMTTYDTSWADFGAKCLFMMANAMPVILSVTIITVAAIRVWASSPLAAIASIILSTLLYGSLMYISWKLLRPEKVRAIWQTRPTPRQ